MLHTFKWGKIPMVISALVPCSWRKPINSMCQCKGFPKWMRLPEEVDRWEAMIIVAVSALTIAFNLVVGVGVGLVLACVRFTYGQSLATTVVVASSRAGEPKRYVLQGKLFFGVALRFQNFFDVDNDPDQVVLQLPERPTEYSAVDALSRVSALYAAANKRLTIEIVNVDVEMSSTNVPDAAPTPKVVDVVSDEDVTPTASAS